MAKVRADVLVAAQCGVSEKEAEALLMERRVFAGELPVVNAGTMLAEDTVLTVRDKAKKYASRSGYKLEKALPFFGVDAKGLVACDIGASNGGFTDCLLQNGAAKVFAVDVAYGILEWRLRQDPRVVVMERQNARYLTAELLGEQVDLVTCDVSFIGLKKIFPAMRAVLKEDGACICLIKPQFELPQKDLGKNGVPKDKALLPPLFLRILADAAENGLYLQGLTVSPIHGQNGNVEFLTYLGGKPRFSAEEIEALCNEVALLPPDSDESI